MNIEIECVAAHLMTGFDKNNIVIGGNAFVIKSVLDKTKAGIKSPELQYKNGDKPVRDELERDDDWFYVI